MTTSTKMKILLCVEREEPCRSSKLDLMGYQRGPLNLVFARTAPESPSPKQF